MGNDAPFDLPKVNVDSALRIIRWAFLGLAIVLLLLALNWVRSFYTDLLWFGNVGYEAVLIKIISTRVWLFLLGIAASVAFGSLNLYLVLRLTRNEPAPDNVPVTYETYRILRKIIGWILMAVLGLIGIIFAITLSNQWDMVLKYLNSVPFAQLDPIFQKDISFYVFTLPLLNFLQSWTMGIVIVSLLFSGVLYFIIYGLRTEGLRLPQRTRIHLAVLGALIFLLIAVGHWLGRYELLYSTLGTVIGVGYANMKASLPALQLLTLVALISAVLLLAGAMSSGYRLVIGAIALWVGLAVLGGNIYPTIVQRFQVEPSELERERIYLANNIELTRTAYGLDRNGSTLDPRSHPAIGKLDKETIAQNQGTLQNIRLWDEGPLLDVYNQIQFFRLYYDFLDVTADRYEMNGELRQVMVSTRELSAEKLPQEAQRWVNRHLQFTHGYGVAASPVTEVAGDGSPHFLVKDVPPKISAGMPALDRPEIYYGLQSLDFLIVNSNMDEFNYPGPDGPVYKSYAGTGGVLLSSFFRKLLFAWKFTDVNILISGEIKPESYIQYRRTVPERFSAITPFLIPDNDPYIVMANGGLFWIQDAYTITDKYPYSTPYESTEPGSDKFNYMRNSVKAVVDAYEGTVEYYISDPTDPIINTYAQIFPNLFKPMSEMDPDIQTHIRYPRDFFSVQTQMMLQYHMQDPVVFYNKEDQWSLPLQSSFGETQVVLEPYYIVARLPDAEHEEFLLIQPFTPADRENLIAWTAARNDSPNYGELVLYQFPAGRQVFGPNQVEANINKHGVISEHFTYWGREGSEVSKGVLLVIPVGDTILYAEPVFLEPETLDFPDLRRIILADSETIVMHPTLDRSIRALEGELLPIAPTSGEEVFAKVKPTDFVSESDEEDGLSLDQSLASSLEEAMKQLQRVLDRLREHAKTD
jgi:uncharacterized membrane protein (UPF0182 family)